MDENDNTLRQLQLTQLDILKIIDKICRENGLRYSLYAGTLIGAVRHKGFIPWDDDLDICMSRSDYNRFIKLWNIIKPEGYLLQNKENSPDFTQSFTKIRKDHTTFLQSDLERGKYHVGIFVDIFPIDRMPTNKVEKFFFWWNCLKYQLYTREFIPPKGNFVEKMVSSILLKSVPRKKRKQKREKLLQKITRFNNDSTLPTVAIEITRTMKQPMPSSLMNQFIYLSFEGSDFMCFKEWDEYLKRKYGDYMKLPPESECMWKHHPLIIDFTHNLEEIGD